MTFMARVLVLVVAAVAGIAGATGGSEWAEVEAKMVAAGSTQDFISAFKLTYDAYVSGDLGMISEASIDPVSGADVPDLEAISVEPDMRLLGQTVMMKLNGGLGTSMGLEQAKSLLTVKGAETFLDLIAQQVLRLREKHSFDVRFMLMNSFSTSADTLELLRTRYPVLANDTWLEVVQNKAPKIEAGTNKPAAHPPNPKLEWAPPGHGDLYPTLRGSGMLRKLVAAGYKYMFISNSDNLGKAPAICYGSLRSASHALNQFQQTHSKSAGALRGDPRHQAVDPLRGQRSALHDGGLRTDRERQEGR